MFLAAKVSCNGLERAGEPQGRKRKYATECHAQKHGQFLTSVGLLTKVAHYSSKPFKTGCSKCNIGPKADSSQFASRLTMAGQLPVSKSYTDTVMEFEAGRLLAIRVRCKQAPVENMVKGGRTAEDCRRLADLRAVRQSLRGIPTWLGLLLGEHRTYGRNPRGKTIALKCG